MTGRRLYDLFTDAAKNEHIYSEISTGTVLPSNRVHAVAWPFLAARDRAIWNALARRITPKRKAADRA